MYKKNKTENLFHFILGLFQTRYYQISCKAFTSLLGCSFQDFFLISVNFVANCIMLVAPTCNLYLPKKFHQEFSESGEFRA